MIHCIENPEQERQTVAVLYCLVHRSDVDSKWQEEFSLSLYPTIQKRIDSTLHEVENRVLEEVRDQPDVGSVFRVDAEFNAEENLNRLECMVCHELYVRRSLPTNQRHLFLDHVISLLIDVVWSDSDLPFRVEHNGYMIVEKMGEGVIYEQVYH